MLSDWLQPIDEAYEQLEQQNVKHPTTHQVHFVQNSETITMYKPSTPKLLCLLKDGSHQFQLLNIQKHNPEERHVNAKTPGLCFNCLSWLKVCLSKSTSRMINCHQRPNTLFHRVKTTPESNSVKFCDKQ